MRNSSCIICFKEFEPRAGKLYCSNACKQKGYSDKKNIAMEIGNSPKVQEERKAGKQFIIYFDDYQEYRNKYPKSLEEFTLFCFFRKNWTGLFDMEKFHIYVNSFDTIWWQEFWDTEGIGKVSPARKKYNEFQEQFFGGDDFIVSLNKNNV